MAALLADDATAPATVIREHLQRAGYGGGIAILKDYLAAVRPEFEAARDHIGLKVGKTLEAAQRQEGGPQVPLVRSTPPLLYGDKRGALAARRGAPPTGGPRKAGFRHRHGHP